MVALLRAKREALQNVPSFTRACGPFARMEIQLRREPIQNIPPLIRCRYIGFFPVPLHAGQRA